MKPIIHALQCYSIERISIVLRIITQAYQWTWIHVPISILSKRMKPMLTLAQLIPATPSGALCMRLHAR